MREEIQDAFSTVEARRLGECLSRLDDVLFSEGLFPYPQPGKEKTEKDRDEVLAAFLDSELLVKQAREYAEEVKKRIVKPWLQRNGSIVFGDGSGAKVILETPKTEKCMDLLGAVERIFIEGADKNPDSRQSGGISAVAMALSSSALKTGHLRKTHATCFTDFFLVESGESKPVLWKPQAKKK